MPDSQQTQILPGELRNSGPALGTILRNRYRLDSELGRGGMGTVYRATDLELEREVAVKVLSTTSQTSDARDRLIREARAAAALNHPHIVTIHDVGEESGQPFLVMELVPGPRLSQARPSDLARVVEIATQICAALEHAHTNQIVHRDLKPDNVLLSGSSYSTNVKLADLGLALPAYGARISRAGVIVGTAAYMAPEQALGQTVDGRADLYALGVLLYELTTGRVPFTGDDPLTIVSQHVHAPVVPPRVLRPDLPRRLEAIIIRLLAKDPAQRFASATETRAALAESLIDGGDTLSGEIPVSVAILEALSRGRLVGRANELNEARELWQRAREGRGHAVLLSGEPGAGKTRLARELTIQAAVDGALVLTGDVTSMKRPRLTCRLSKRFGAGYVKRKTTTNFANCSATVRRRSQNSLPSSSRVLVRSPNATNSRHTKNGCSSSTQFRKCSLTSRAGSRSCSTLTICTGPITARFGCSATCCGNCVRSAC